MYFSKKIKNMAFYSNWFGGGKAKEQGIPLMSIAWVNGLWVPQSASDLNYIRNFHNNDYIYTIISEIADKASDAPGRVMRIKEQKEFKKYINHVDAGNFKNNIWKIHKEKAFEEVKHDFMKVIEKPNSIDTEKSLKEQYFGYILATGNGYIYFDTLPGSTKPINLWCLPSPTVSVVMGDRINPVKGYRVGLNINDDIEALYMMHGKKLRLSDGNDNNWIYGQSPMSALCNVIGLTESAVHTMGRAFSNQGANGIISANSDESIDQDNATLLQQRMAERVYAQDAKGRVVITGENIKYTEIGFSLNDLKVIESDEVFMRRIANVYKYPIDRLKGSGTYNNSETSDTQFVTRCVVPLIRAFDELMTKKIQELYNDNSLIWVTDLEYFPELSSDRNKRAEYLNKASWLTVDEKRIADDYEPIGGEAGNAILTPMGMVDLKDVVAGSSAEDAQDTGDV